MFPWTQLERSTERVCGSSWVLDCFLGFRDLRVSGFWEHRVLRFSDSRLSVQGFRVLEMSIDKYNRVVEGLCRVWYRDDGVLGYIVRINYVSGNSIKYSGTYIVGCTVYGLVGLQVFGYMYEAEMMCASSAIVPSYCLFGLTSYARFWHGAQSDHITS